MGRARDLANILSSSGNVALDSEIALTLITPTSITATGGSATSSISSTGTVSFTSASAISLNGCFTSTYDNYRIIFTLTASSGNPSITFRVRSGASDKTAADYYFGGWNNQISVGPVGSYRGTGLTQWSIGDISSAQAARYFTIMDIANPFGTTATKASYTGHYGNASDFWGYGVGAMIADSTSYDGFTMISSTGTITGKISVYGYKN